MSADPVTIAVFIVIILITLGITAWASMWNKDTSYHYAAGNKITGWQNGLAITSDLVSASTFLGVVGLISVGGLLGFYLGVGGTVAFLLILLLLAEPLRNLGKYTIADVLMSRFNTRNVRTITSLAVLVISLFYMIGQFVGAGAIMNLLLGLDYSVAVIVIGVLMAVYITAGGMLATTWIQIVQAVILLGALFTMVFLVLARFNFNPLAIFDGAASQAGGDMFRLPSGTFSEDLNLVSPLLAQVLGTAARPHILIRFFTVPDAKTARNSIVVATWILSLVFLTIPILGYGAVVLVGQDTIAEASAGGNLAAPQLAEVLGGSVLLAIVSAAAFAAILSTAAGLVIAATGAFAHDIYNNTLRNGEASEREQLLAARITSVIVPIIAILIALGAQGYNIALLTLLAVNIAVSTTLPAILLTIFWKKFNMNGVLIGMLAGLICSVGLILLGPDVMGENALFPLTQPALVSMPIAFLGCYLGSLLGRSRAREESEQGIQASYEEIYVRTNTGISDIDEALEKETARQS